MTNEEKKVNSTNESCDSDDKKDENKDNSKKNETDSAESAEKVKENASENNGCGGEEDKSERTGAESPNDRSEDEDVNDRYIRLMADFQNYKRRMEQERSRIYLDAKEDMLLPMLTVLDNFERALGNECRDEAYAEGMKMIFDQLADTLKKTGLEEIEAEGEDFDPSFHHAVLTEDNAEFESGKVTEVMQKGYKLNQKVIRPAMVKVNN